MNLNRNERISQAKFVTWVGLWVNVVLSILKLVAGYFGRSTAIIADGIHSLSDSVTDVLVLVGFNFASKPIDESHDFGHGKFETLSSTLIGLILMGVGIGILWSGIDKIMSSFSGEVLPVPGWIAFWAALISILANESLYWYQKVVGEKLDSRAIVANAWHHRSDALTSVASIIGIGGAILLGDQWVVLDPLAAVLVSFMIVKVSYDILKGSILELTEASLGKEAKSKILEISQSIPEVRNPHHIRTRKIGSYAGIDMHIEVDKSLNVAEAHNISHKLENAIKKEFGDESFVNIHVEPMGYKKDNL
jgi:cation diffusion facilitator family transporter